MATKPTATNEQVKVVDPPEKWIDVLSACVLALESAQPETRHAVFGFLRSKYRGDWPSSDY